MRNFDTRLDKTDPENGENYSVGVIIATRGRPEVVSRVVSHLTRTQTYKRVQYLVSCADPRDAGECHSIEGVRIVSSTEGLAAQRNTGLAALRGQVDIVVFFDDDFVADELYISEVVNAFASNQAAVAITGHVLVDDIKGPGLSFENAREIVQQRKLAKCNRTVMSYSPYGCNMAFRMSAISDLSFDEKLVMYGWLEDFDFGASLAKRGGKLIKIFSARGVHMGVKTGRSNGVKLRYSQVINPVYLYLKGNMALRSAIRQISKNFLSNVARALRPEQYIDRRGRLKGNFIGISHVFRGIVRPEKVSEL